jgi:hypothetical protein
MSKEKILEAYRALGEAVAYEMSLGEQLIQLNIAQRKAHEATMSARDLAEHLLEDKVI